jgi:hypothetical protein
VWDTACGNKFVFNDGTPTENGQRWCGYCGGLALTVPSRRPSRKQSSIVRNATRLNRGLVTRSWHSLPPSRRHRSTTT